MASVAPIAAAESAASAGDALPVALAIVEQPPGTWYKDQFGRKATFGLRVRRALAPCARCAELRHLTVTLLYESGKVVDNQSVLRVATGLCLDKTDSSELAVRIMEVSKNHQNQRFRLQIALAPCPDSCHALNVAVTDPVLVLSKKNKRPARADDEDSPSKIKKTRGENDGLATPTPAPPPAPRATPLPSLLKSGPFKSDLDVRKDSSETSRTGISLQMADMFTDDPMDAGEPCWDSQPVPFTTPNARVCLWANAAYNFLNKLQWQPYEPPSSNNAVNAGADVNDIFAQHLHKKFQCGVCREVYSSSTPVHREDCDLGLLIQQGRQSATRNEHKSVHSEEETTTENQQRSELPGINQVSRSQGFFPTGKVDSLPPLIAKTPSPMKALDGFKFSELLHNDAARPSIGVDHGKPLTALVSSSGLEALAKSLDLSSWEGYSSLSRIMFSGTLDSSKVADWDATTRVQAKVPGKNVSPATSNTATGFPPNALQFSQPNAPGQQSFSSFLSTMKMMPADSVALLQEDEAALTGDASLLCSLSRVSLTELTDFMQQAEDNKLPSPVPKVSAVAGANPPVLLTVDRSDRNNEKSVWAIVARDFLHCGLPALDAKKQLVGFYMLSDSGSEHSALHFLPNLYPLVPQMLQELEQEVDKVVHDPNVFFSRADASAKALDDLKRAVAAAASRSARAG